MADVGLYYLQVRYFQDLDLDQGFYGPNGPDLTAIPSITQELIIQVDPCKIDSLILSPQPDETYILVSPGLGLIPGQFDLVQEPACGYEDISFDI